MPWKSEIVLCALEFRYDLWDFSGISPLPGTQETLLSAVCQGNRQGMFWNQRSSDLCSQGKVLRDMGRGNKVTAETMASEAIGVKGVVLIKYGQPSISKGFTTSESINCGLKILGKNCVCAEHVQSFCNSLNNIV
jgi:hypothetical protein